MSEIPKEWQRLSEEEPQRWAMYLAEIDQLYAKAQTDLDNMIDLMVGDIAERPEKIADDDVQPTIALSSAMFQEIRRNEGISFDLIAVYNVALYRLARQRIKAMAAS
jgi:hypothetical protein